MKLSVLRACGGPLQRLPRTVVATRGVRLALKTPRLSPVSVRAMYGDDEAPRGQPFEGSDPNSYPSKVDGITVSQVIGVLGVKEIKEALRVRGLSPTGRKKDLLDRLVESIYAEIGYQADVDRQFSQIYPEIGSTSRRPDPSGHPSMENLMDMTASELKDLCKAGGLSIIGSKAELARRVYAFHRGEAPEGEAPVAGSGFQWQGNMFFDPRKMTLKDLRESLKAINLPITGTKPELVARLEAALYDPAGAQERANERGYPAEYRPPRKDNSVRGELANSDRFVASMDWVAELGAMRVSDLRQQLEERGLSTDGTKQELIDRLAMQLQAELPPPRSVESTISELVAKLSILELRRELRDRELSTQGTRGELVSRLELALLDEYSRGMWSQLDGDQGAWEEAEASAPLPTMAQVLNDPDLRIGVICGGPSGERGVSLNSARSLLDHLQTAPRQDHHVRGGITPDLSSTEVIGGLDVVPYYLDQGNRPHLISQSQLYSNTPSDFDFKLQQAADEGGVSDQSRSLGSLEELVNHMKGHVHVAFPAVHGRFGEDGQLQRLLEEAGIPFVGTGSAAASVAFNKASCKTKMESMGYAVLDSVVLSEGDNETKQRSVLSSWLAKRGESTDNAPLVVKPASSGSSLGVEVVRGLDAAVQVASRLLMEGVDTSVVVEPFVTEGIEFTVIVLETDKGPVALLPTEVEIVFQDEDINEANLQLQIQLGLVEPETEGLRAAYNLEERIFNYRRKYLPTSQVKHHTPARLPLDVIQAIRRGAGRLFKELGLRDFARLDGWVVRDPSGEFRVLSKPTPSYEGGYAENWREGQRMNADDVVARMASATDRPELLALAKEHADRWSRVSERRMGLTETQTAAEIEADRNALWSHILPELTSLPVGQLCRPTEDRAIVFTDVNVVSGLEQTSFLFQQAAQVGIGHMALLRQLLRRACARAGLPSPPMPLTESVEASALTGLSYDELDHLLGGGDVDEDADGGDDGGANAARSRYAGDGMAAGPSAWGEDGEEDIRAEEDGVPPAWEDVEDGREDEEDDAGRLFDEYDRAPAFAAEAGIPGPTAEFGSSAPGSLSARAELNPGDRRIWVLFGGESSERQVSVLSGVNVWLKLRSIPGLVVEPFLLAPPGYMGQREKERRALILQRRNEMLSAGMPEWALPADLSSYNINLGGGHKEVALDRRSVWALPYPFCLRHTVEDIVDDCNRWSQMLGAAEIARTDAQRDELDLHRFVQTELSEGGVESVASLWSSDPSVIVPSPRMMDFETFALEARGLGATVLLALHGGVGENGILQAFLEQVGVPFTGAGSMASQLAMDKVETAQQLRPLEPQGISCAPKHVLSVEDLVEATSTPEGAAFLFDQLKAALGPQSSSLCIKPVSDGCSTGVARIASGEDLRTFAAAVANGWHYIPEGLLSTPHAAIEMPRPSPPVFMMEPFISTDPVIIRRDENGGESLEWVGRSRWVEVTIGLYGDEGRMRSFTPSLTVKQSGEVLSLEEKFQGGTGINLTPPPESIVAPAAVDGAKRRAEQVATSLGLRGVARIDAFMHVDTGELVIIEANSIPGLTPATVLMQQALAEDPPIFPAELFLRMVEHASAVGPAGAGSVLGVSLPDLDLEPENLGDADDLGSYGDDLLLANRDEEDDGLDTSYRVMGGDEDDSYGGAARMPALGRGGRGAMDGGYSGGAYGAEEEDSPSRSF